MPPTPCQLLCNPRRLQHPAPTWLSSRSATMAAASVARMRCSVARRLLSFRRRNLSSLLSSGEDERRLWFEPAEHWAALGGGEQGWHCQQSSLGYSGVWPWAWQGVWETSCKPPKAVMGWI